MVSKMFQTAIESQLVDFFNHIYIFFFRHFEKAMAANDTKVIEDW